MSCCWNWGYFLRKSHTLSGLHANRNCETGAQSESGTLYILLQLDDVHVCPRGDDQNLWWLGRSESGKWAAAFRNIFAVALRRHQKRRAQPRKKLPSYLFLRECVIAGNIFNQPVNSRTELYCQCLCFFFGAPTAMRTQHHLYHTCHRYHQ